MTKTTNPHIYVEEVDGRFIFHANIKCLSKDEIKSFIEEYMNNHKTNTTKIEPDLHSVDEVTISRELYDRLTKDRVFLVLLRAYGVDNWSGYDEVVRVLNGDNEDDEI